MISVRNLSTSYGNKNILRQISFDVNAGEILGILGENGSGKSTMIKSICNILPHKGACFCEEVHLEELSARQLARYCSYVPQKSGVEIEISALDVVLMGFNTKLQLLELPSQDMICRAKCCLEKIGLQDKINSNFMSLSEGQKQLCILMRAMVADSQVMLMDEPENALDVRMRYRMMKMIRQWVNEGKHAVVVALHDSELALNCCDRLLLIKDGEIVDNLVPRNVNTNDLEGALSKIYGKVCIRKVPDSQGVEHLVMLKEDEL